MKFKTLQRTLAAGVALQQSGQFDEAERQYAQVRRSAPNLFDGWYLSGTLAFHRGGHLEAAVEFLQRALRIDPRAGSAKLFLGMALADLGRFAEAEQPLRAALLKLPGYAEAWDNLAKILAETGRSAEAGDCRRRALALPRDQAGRAEPFADRPTVAGAETLLLRMSPP